MSEFEGNLLIGGAALKCLHGDLREERPDRSYEWLLTGQLRLPRQVWPNVTFNRQYRLELADGRSGQVIFTEPADQNGDEMIVNFRPIGRDQQKAN